MRTLLAVVALVLGTAVYATQPAATPQRPEGKIAVVLVERIQDLNLTDDQEAKIADIRKEYRPKVQEAAKDLATVAKDEVEKLQGVLTPDQKKKLEGIREERREFRGERLAERLAHLEELDLTEGEAAKLIAIRKEYQSKIEKTMTEVGGLFTGEQKKAREEALNAGKTRKEVIASVKLTDDQKAKLETVGKELRTLVREEMEKMRDVLAEGQTEKLQEFKEERREAVRNRKAHALAEAKDLNLTEDQKTKIMGIRKDYRPKVQEAGNKMRATVREEVEAILNVLKS